MQERRAFPRTGLSLPVHLTVVPDGSGSASDESVRNLTGTTHDMSRGGCAVITEIPIAERSRCIARFPLATGRVDPDTVWAEVRRAQPHEGGVLLGIEFETPLNRLRISPDPDPAGKRATRSPSILIVDDQSGIRGLLSRYLGERGFAVRTAGDGEEAFGLLLQEIPNVLLLDLYLPRLNGHDLLRRMQETGIQVDLIFTMSGHAEASDARECLRLGATDHVLKPIDFEHLHRSILLRLGVRATA